MQARKFDELISYFNRKVSSMDIDQKYKMELLGMITAIGLAYEKEMPHWIPCSERLPEAEVLCCDIRGEMIIGYPYKDDESETGYSAVLDDVYMIDCIAWMEKPEPYREGEG